MTEEQEKKMQNVGLVFNRFDKNLTRIANKLYKLKNDRRMYDLWEQVGKYKMALTLIRMKRTVDQALLPYTTKSMPTDLIDPEDRYAQALEMGYVRQDITYNPDKREALFALIFHALILFQGFIYQEEDLKLQCYELLRDALESLGHVAHFGYDQCELYGSDVIGYTLVPTEWKEQGNEWENVADRLKGD